MSWQNELREIYGSGMALELEPKVSKLISNHNLECVQETENSQNVVLITYPDQFSKDGISKLESFSVFAERYLKGVFDVIHFLPFCPYSSDNGFSVIDYMRLADGLGSWDDLKRLGNNYTLMYDFVCNHVSSVGKWATAYKSGDSKYKDYFIEKDACDDYSKVVRPRTSTLFSEVETKFGKRELWTTFGSDQWDLNYKNPEVLLSILDVLLSYIERGGRWIRLDAIGFLWKESGSTCLNLPKTHAMVRLFRSVLDQVCPSVRLITETNVPHKDNIAYFGNGENESHMVYQFALPVLTLYSFFRQSAVELSKWAKSLSLPSEKTSFFNFLASHDGVGLNPARGILPENEILNMVEHYRHSAGALVSYKDQPDGSKAPYELNVSYFSALCESYHEDVGIRRFLTAHAILLGLKGVAAIYIHSYLGSRNYIKGVEESGQNRMINREKFNLDVLLKELETGSEHEIVRSSLQKLIQIRKANSAFDSASDQKVVELDERVFSFVRTSKNQEVYCLNNFSSENLMICFPSGSYRDLLTGECLSGGSVQLDSYEHRWLVHLE